MLATSYNFNKLKHQTSFNPEWTKEHKFISKAVHFSWILHTVCICEMCIYLFFAFIICLFLYFYYFQKSRNVMFSGTVPYYLFIYVFLLFPEVQKCYVFRHCVYCKTGSSHITMSLANTNTVNKHFFDSSVTHRSTSRYLVNQIFWQWIE